jgi:hypothetical protein
VFDKTLDRVMANLIKKSPLDKKIAGENATLTLELFLDNNLYLKRGAYLAPKIGTNPIRLTPPVRPFGSCSRSGNDNTGLTGGPRVRVELRNPSEFRLVKGFLAGQDLPTL